jgi:hypothetical protein
MTTFAVTSVNSLLCEVSTCFRIGSKFLCIRSTPTEMQSMSENDFECFASTGVKTPVTKLPKPQALFLGGGRLSTDENQQTPFRAPLIVGHSLARSP